MTKFEIALIFPIEKCMRLAKLKVNHENSVTHSGSGRDNIHSLYMQIRFYGSSHCSLLIATFSKGTAYISS